MKNKNKNKTKEERSENLIGKVLPKWRQNNSHHAIISVALEISKELYNELFIEKDFSNMQRYKLEELIEMLEDVEDGKANMVYAK